MPGEIWTDSGWVKEDSFEGAGYPGSTYVSPETIERREREKEERRREWERNWRENRDTF